MGRACATRVRLPGEHLVLLDLDAAGLEVARAELDVSGDASISVVVGDITDASTVVRLTEAISSAGTLGRVIHAAGVSPRMADWRRVFEIDLVGSAGLLAALGPLVREGTAAVCFASVAGHLAAALPDPAVEAVLDEPLADDFLERLEAAAGPAITEPTNAYARAKQGVQRLVRRQAIEWGRAGGRVCSISPGLIDTPQGRLEFEHEPMMATMIDSTPLGGRWGNADEVAAVASFLTSGEASFVTGVDLTVDGGCLAAVGPLVARYMASESAST